jgi:hypothetical protein
VKLNPAIPPGRSNRKAREFSVEIARLCMHGYGCKAIREALAEAGVNVSKSTVQREIARLSRPVARGLQLATPAHRPPELDSPAAPTTALHRLAEEPRSGKDIAEAFMKGRITNPLFRNRS